MPETLLKRSDINDFVLKKFLEIFALSLFQNNFKQMFLNFEKNRKGNEEIWSMGGFIFANEVNLSKIFVNLI